MHGSHMHVVCLPPDLQLELHPGLHPILHADRPETACMHVSLDPLSPAQPSPAFAAQRSQPSVRSSRTLFDFRAPQPLHPSSVCNVNAATRETRTPP